ncbi:MAG: transporter substrate-binding domain-containing protein [Rhodoferax sp.]|nr:transporter substrate-binding domain-containing protein [Rhodoferax sp.]
MAQVRWRLCLPGLQRLALGLLLCWAAAVSALAADAGVPGGKRSFLTHEENAWLDSQAAIVHVAPEGNYPPFSFTQSGAWQGLSADYLRLIEDRLQLHFQVLPAQNLGAILKQVQAGNADLVTSLKSTPERDKFLAFTPPYVKVPTVIVMQSGAGLGKWPEAFVGKRVAVGAGYGVQHYLEHAYPGVALTPVSDDLDGLRKLAFAEVDAVIMDVASASYFIEQEKITGLRIHSEFEYEYELSFAVRKDWGLLRDVLRKTLEQIPEADKQAVLAKWIHLERNPLQMLQARIAPWLPWLLLLAAAIGSGLVVAFLGRRRRLREALAAARYARRLIEASIDPLFTLSESGKVIDVNSAAARMTGVSREALMGSDFAQHFTDPAKAMGVYQQVMAEGLVTDYALQLRHADGNTTEVLLNASAYGDDQGRPQGVLATARDVTQIENAKLQLEALNRHLQEQQAFTRTIADAIPSMIGYWGADLRCRFANKAYESWFRADVPSIEGMHIQRVLDEERFRVNEPRMHAALAGQRQVFQRETSQADGSVEFHAVTYIPHVLQSQVLGFFVLAEDITELKHAENSLLLLNEELAVQANAAREANVAKSAFLANMSHEIRTPLGAITGMAKLIRREPLSSVQADRLDKLELAARHLGATISDILDLSKIEANKIVLEEEPVDFPALIKSVAQIVLESAQQKDLQLHTDIADLPQGLLGDETRLRQAMLNFAANAVKFTHAGSITLRARLVADLPDNAVLRLEVEDTGVGIAADQIPKLFEPFVQADSSTTRKYGGSGLGLTITKRLAEAMGGEVGLHSELGKGSIFWLTARLKKGALTAPAQLPQARTDAAEQIRQGFAGQRVLLVDDDEFNREIGHILLQDVGLEVDLAEDGQAALDRVRQRSYALILMDMQMPRLDGLQATRQLRAAPASAAIPIVAMTANAFKEDRMRCLQAGMDDFITKPVDPEMLYTTILRLLQEAAAPAAL